MTTAPFPLTGFVDRLKPKDAFFNLGFRDEFSEGADGTIYVKDLAPELWRCDFTTIDLPHIEIQALQAELNLMREGAFTFYAHDPVAAYPQRDPGGVILGSSTVQIKTLNGSDSRKLSLKGLPVGYHLLRGDKLSFLFGDDSDLLALHQVYADNIAADGSGETVEFLVNPPIRPGAEVDTEVTLKKPSCLMTAVPGSVKYTVVNRMKSNLSFSAIQVLTAD